MTIFNNDNDLKRKTDANWNFHGASSSNFTYARYKVTFFMKHFSILPILYEGYVNQFWLLYIGRLLICGCTSALLSFVYKILVQFIQSRKVDAITSILRKIQNPSNLFSDFGQIFERELPTFYLELKRTISLKT